MHKLKVIPSVLLVYVLVACSSDEKKSGDEVVPIKNSTTGRADTIIGTFSLPYPENLMLDSNSLIFYRERYFDTSSMIHIQKRNSKIRGVYYQVLPAYHLNVDDFANGKNNLVFFEGYAFTIDTTSWQKISEKAKAIIQANDTFDSVNYKDGATYALYFGLLSKYGNSNNSSLYESFDLFLKTLVLDSIIDARKPKFFKRK